MPSFLKLNNYFPDDKSIDDVIQYKQTNKLPDTANTPAKEKDFQRNINPLNQKIENYFIIIKINIYKQ